MQLDTWDKAKRFFKQIAKLEDNNVQVRSLSSVVTIYNIHIGLIVALVIVALLLVWLKPISWQQGLVGPTVTVIVYSINLIWLRIRPSYRQGVVGLLLGAFINIWIVTLGIGYSASPIFWIAYIPLFTILLAGYKIGLLFLALNLAIFSAYHYITWASQSTFVKLGPSIAENPLGYFISTALFLIFTGIFGAVLDYMHKRSQKKLIVSEHKRNLYLSQTSMAVIEAAENGEIIEWNRAAESIFGYELAEIAGKNVFEVLVDRNDHISVPQMLEQLRLNQDPELKYTIQNRTKNGQNITCEWFNTPIRNEQGQITSFILSAVNVTERIAYQLELETAREAAEEATKAKSAFLANMSHEIRTPMNGVIGMTSLLAHTQLSTEQFEQVEIIRKSGTALLDVINEILDFSKIESGKLELEHHSFYLEGCVKDAIDLFTSVTQQKEIVIMYCIGPNVPSLVSGDAGRLRQILVNLIGNATKFTESGTIRVTINRSDDAKVPVDQEVEQKVAQELVELHFAVSDTGIGIHHEHIGSLFDSFSQTDTSTTRKYGGTGLGLAITKHLVTMMQGQIWAESTPGKGSTFSFTVRLEPTSATHRNGSTRYATESESTNERLIQSPDSAISSAISPAILIAEDNIVNQKVALRYLERLGYSADIVSNGVEAIEAVSRQRYNLILMDAQMPEMDGLEATRQIRRLLSEQDQPLIVALSASVLESDKHKAVDAGMDDFLSKPLQLDELNSVLQSLPKRNALMV